MHAGVDIHGEALDLLVEQNLRNLVDYLAVDVQIDLSLGLVHVLIDVAVCPFGLVLVVVVRLMARNFPFFGGSLFDGLLGNLFCCNTDLGLRLSL